MKKGTKLLMGVVILVLLIIGAIILGLYLANKNKNADKSVANGIILDSLKDSSNRLLTTYDEYLKLLDDYKINDVVLLTNNDFETKDYIIDYINYENGLEISDIEIMIADNGLELSYKVNKVIENNDSYLMYFIPVDKGSIVNPTVINRKFNTN